MSPKIYFFKILILGFALASFFGCATAPRGKMELEKGALFLKDVCQQNNLHCQWDSTAYIVTIYYEHSQAKVMVGSEVAFIDGNRSFLSAPLRMSQSRIVVPQDFNSKVVDALKKKKVTFSKTPLPVKPLNIVIDAGHGGKDPGAIGINGSREKEIVLDISRRVHKLLKSKGINSRMTRQKDEFITLNERTEIASQAKADLFVSIHANASPSKSVQGVEVYCAQDLSYTDKNEIQRKENQKQLFKNLSMKRIYAVEEIIEDLLYMHKQSESFSLADDMAQTISREMKTKNLGGKESRFFVLRNTLVPAILIEVGFLTNYKEEKMLRSGYSRQKIAEAITEGLLDYAAQLDQ